MIKSGFDLSVAILGVVITLPILVLVTCFLLLDSKGSPFIFQERIGKNFKPFYLIKFRTMKPFSEQIGLLTIGDRDPRVTKFGYWLRKFKIDELPQLINVIKGEMSLVGPRPEVAKYVSLYQGAQKNVLLVRPGITDPASIFYWNESAILAQNNNPEEFYIQEIMPHKLSMNLHYIQNQSFVGDLKIIIQTILLPFKK
jgi:lipopolysaccharide/colanic/teichoic acid biosynthesis glycosyltransferase